MKTYYGADEITQDVFISLWTGRVNLEKVLVPKSYLFTIAYNHINKALRKESHQEVIREWLLVTQDLTSNETSDALNARELEQLIQQGIEKLPPQKKLVYKMSRQQGRSNEEIAKALQLSPHTVKDHLKDAVHLLRKHLGNVSLFLLL